MRYYTYEELANLIKQQLKAENPNVKPNIKNIGLWLKSNGYIKIRRQIDKVRKVYYYLPDKENLTENID